MRLRDDGDRTFRASWAALKPGASLYVCHGSSYQREFQNALEGAGFEIRCQIVWAKNTFAWGFGRYKFLAQEPNDYAGGIRRRRVLAHTCVWRLRGSKPYCRSWQLDRKHFICHHLDSPDDPRR